MNKLCYRIVFNKARQMMMVVSELARAHGGDTARGPGVTPALCATLSALTFSIWLASGLVSPAQASVIVADRGAAGNQQPTVGVTSNGVAQINIQTPDKNGLSHNKYSQFDVSDRGAILNNSGKNTQTQLGGMVTANPWLAKNQAKVILNEVNSRNPSQLNGFVEVAGARADVIIANPAGITCNGCGFINASRSTLAAGKPLLTNGQLTGFDVDNGAIRIEGRGFNDTQTNYTTLIGRTVSLNARLQVNDLSITTGRNQTDVNGTVITTKTDSPNDKPKLALDVAALGGMYANKIKMVGTEHGVGVGNAGEIGASAGQIALSADGRLTNSGKINASGTLALRGSGISNSGQVQSGSVMTLTASDISNTGTFTSQDALSVSGTALSNSGTLRATRALNVSASERVTHSGAMLAGSDVHINTGTLDAARGSAIGAGIDTKGSATQAGNLTLSASGKLTAQGQLLASGAVSASGQTLDMQYGQVKGSSLTLSASKGDIDARNSVMSGGTRAALSASGKLLNDGGALSADALTLNASIISNRSGGINQTGSGPLAITTAQLDNTSGSLTAANGLALKTSALINTSGQIGVFNGDLTINTGTLDNQQGTVILEGSGRLGLDATTFNGSRGRLVSQGELALRGHQVTLDNAQTQVKQLSLTAASLSHRNATLVQTGGGTARVAVSGALDNSGGQIASQGSMQLNSGTLDNHSGELISQGALTLTSTLVNNNKGQIVGQQNLDLSSSGLDNRAGLVQAGNNLTLDTRGGTLDNRDTTSGVAGIRAGAALTLNSGNLVNQQGLIAGASLKATASDVDNCSGQISSKSGLSLTARGLNNQSGMLSNTAGLLNLALSGLADNQRGVMQSGGALALKGDALSNLYGTLLATGGVQQITLARGLDNQNGRIAGQQGISITAATLNNIAGTLSSPGGAMQLALNGSLNNQQGLIESGAALTLSATDADNRKGTLHAAGGDARLTLAGVLLNQNGQLVGQQAVALFNTALNNQQGRITGTHLELTTGATENSGGLMQATRDFTLNTRSARVNNGDSAGSNTGIRAGGTLTLNTGEVNNQSGLIAAGTLNASGGSWNNTVGQINSLGDINFTTGTFNNSGGQIQAGATLNLDAGATAINNASGLMLANAGLNLSGAELSNLDGTLQGNGGLSLNHTDINNQRGKLLSGGDFTLNASYLNNQSGQLFAWQKIAVRVNDSILNGLGFIKANGALTLTTGQLDNRNARASGQGIEADALDINAINVLNQNGAVRAASRLSMAIRTLLDNRSGLLSAQQMLAINTAAPGVLAINNLSGEMASRGALTLQAQQLNDVGRLTAQDALTLTTLAQLTQNGTLASNGDLTLNAQGGLLNSSKINALGNLALTTSALDNQAGGEINGQTVRIRAGTLTNTGLLDGGENRIIADTLTNIGTGRIYGDWLEIDARRLINTADEQGRAATIAGREGLTIATDYLTNQDHALIYTDGDLAIGGALSEEGELSGLAQKVENLSADIEAIGALAISARQMENRDIHLLLSDEPLLVYVSEMQDEWQFCEGDGDGACFGGDGQRYVFGPWENGNRYAINPDGSKNLGVFIGMENNSDSSRLRFHLNGALSKHFYQYLYQTKVWETQIVNSDSATIRSGKNLTIRGDQVLNQDSRIVAGADLIIDAGSIENRETQGTRRTEEVGSAISYYKGGGSWSTRQREMEYAGNVQVEALSLGLMRVEQSAGRGSGQAVDGRDSNGTAINTQNVNHSTAPDGEAQGSGLAGSGLEAPGSTGTLTPSQPGGVTDVTLPTTDGKPLVARTVTPSVKLPDSSLFALRPGTDSHYLIETDSRYTNGKQWISSQEIWGDELHKRLGDGFYEQRLVREQIQQATGQRFLSGLDDDNEQYRQLLNNGRTFAQHYGLKPGVALTASQMALLTSDMVWFVDQTVTLPDGRTEVVSVPQVYLRVAPGDLSGGGALMSGNRVSLTAGGDVTNSGTVSGREMTTISAENLSNSGFVQGREVSVLAQNDIVNTGGTLLAGDSLSLLAGHDIISLTETGREGTEQWTGRLAGIYVQNDGGELSLKALNDIRLTASNVVNAGKESSTMLAAGRDLILDTQTVTHGTDYTRDSRRYDTTYSTQEAGSTIQAGGDLTLSAGRDVSSRAGSISATDALTVSAGRDITLGAGESTYQHDGRSEWVSRKVLSKTTHTPEGHTTERTAQGTAVDGGTVSMQAGRDLTVQGSSVAATGDVSLVAGRDLTLTTADEAEHDQRITTSKKSGISSSSGGLGFHAGTSSQSTDSTDESNRKLGSTVGSSAGSVSLSAGNTLAVHGSDLVASKDLSLTGRGVAITAAENSHTALTTTEQKTSGLTVALSGAVGSALNTAVTQAKSARDEDSGRLSALKSTQAALTGVSAVQQGVLGGMNGSSVSDGFGVSASLGSQHSRSEQSLQEQTSSGSTLTAGSNLTVRATEKDIRVSGGQLKAGGDMTLDAARDIRLEAAQDSSALHGSNSSSGGSLGVSAGSGGYGLSAGVNRGSGRENGSSVTQQNSTLDAGGTMTLKSGRDTTLSGAQVSGQQVTAEVGRDLHIESLQDTERYDSRQSSGSLSVGLNAGVPSAGISVSRDKMTSDFASVNEQSGIFAGSGGFDVTVGNHTQLDGGVIASTAGADKKIVWTPGRWGSAISTMRRTLKRSIRVQG